MSTNNDTVTLDGLFKEVYADKIENLVPEAGILQKEIKFVPTEKQIGNKYHQPVVLSGEHGVTYASVDSGAFAINTPIALTMKDAQVQGSQLLMASRLSYDAAMRAKTSKNAFAQATGHLIENMMESMARRVEASLLYGSSAKGLAQVTTSVNTDATHTVVTIPAAEWAPGIWSGTENAQLDFYDGAVRVGTGSFTVDSVDVANKKITLSGASGDISALDTQLASDTAEIYFKGGYGNEMAGIDKILTNTGTLFNVSAATYGLWQANSYSAGGALTFNKIQQAVALAVGRGLMEDVTVYVNPDAWIDVMNEQAALRSYDQSFNKEAAENGAKKLRFFGVNGLIEVVAHSFVKLGDAFVLPKKRVKRIGATDITFKLPGDPDDKIFIHLQSNAGVELRNYTDQAVFIDSPAKCVKITGITS